MTQRARPEADEFHCGVCSKIGMIEQAVTLEGDYGPEYVHEDCAGVTKEEQP